MSLTAAPAAAPRPGRQCELRPPLLLQPWLLQGAIWCLVVGLYAVRLSRLLIFPMSLVVRWAAIIVVPFALAALLAEWVARPRHLRRWRELDYRRSQRWLLRLGVFWALCSAGEVLYSGGLPILWLLRHSAKNYGDFGIPSLHGLLNSLLLALALSSLLLWLRSGERRFLILPAFSLFWSLVVISRNLLVVDALQLMLLWGLFRGVRWSFVWRALLAASLLIWIFGAVGDARSGAYAFRSLAQPTERLPGWLPSGFLWAYVYLATPLNNLLFTIQSRPPLHAWTLPNTTSLLFPSVIRKLVYRGGTAVSGLLMTKAFNVSTAFVAPYRDLGAFGVAAYAAVWGAISGVAFELRTDRARLATAVLLQCALLSVFFNHYLYLPVIFQVLWFRLWPQARRVTV